MSTQQNDSPTKPWRVDVLQCRGSAYDVGKQLAEGFRKTPRGRAFKRRRERRPFAFSLKNAQATLETYAPNIWEELHGLADGLEIPLERAVAEFSNGRLRYPKRGCSAVMTGGLYGRNYDYNPRRYDKLLLAIQPKGVHASIGFADRFTGRLDGMNEHGLCVGLHYVDDKVWQPGLVCILIVRIVLDQCATLREAIKLLRRLPHGLSFNYSLMDAGGGAAVVEASPAALEVREDRQQACTNHFQSPTMQAHNRRNIAHSCRRLPALEAWAGESPPADALFKAFNNSQSPVFQHGYATGSGTLHSCVCLPAERRMLVGVGGDAEPNLIDVGRWSGGMSLEIKTLLGQLGGATKPFDPGRRVRARSRAGAGGSDKRFLDADLSEAIFNDVSLAEARFTNVNLEGARFDDINFANAVITQNCNFNGMQIGGVSVKDLFTAYRQLNAKDKSSPKTEGSKE